jgi:tetratricopeptide (TPR) repeat protein
MRPTVLLPMLVLTVLSSCRGLPPPPPEELLREKLAEATERYELDPTDVEATIWLGHWLGYAGRYAEAVDIYTRGLQAHPDSAWLLRFRGHRYISLRRLDDAVADLERADELAAHLPDEPEPDGQPDEAGASLGSLRSNIDYHLGLAYYLRGDFEQALEVYQRGAERARANPDRLVSNAWWRWLTLRQLDRDAEAAAYLDGLELEVEVVENQAYRDLLRLCRGELREPELLVGVSPFTTEFPTRVYGLAMRCLLGGDVEGARARLQVCVDWGPPAAFGRIAAEVELTRL